MSIYFDNNATTMMAPDTIRAMIKWCNKGNPSSSYASAESARGMFTDLRGAIGRMSGVATCCVEARDQPAGGNELQNPSDTPKYTVVFTSGASESNSSAVQCICSAYRRMSGTLPHIITSSVEHKSVIAAVDMLVARGDATADYIGVLPSGHVDIDELAGALDARPDTALVCIMHANNESGAINDVRGIGELCADRGVPFHCDVVQSWGRHPDTAMMGWCDSWSISFHKLCGPPGVGAWCIRTQLLAAYNLDPLILGTQNGGMRGGTENVPGLGAALAAVHALDYTPGVRTWVRTLRARLMGLIERAFDTMLYADYVGHDPRRLRGWRGIVWLSGSSADTGYLGGTVLLSVVRPAGEPAVCNTEMKDELAAAGIIVSVGSACNTSSKKASHVLYAMGCDDVIRRGTLRVSMACQNTPDEVDEFVGRFAPIARIQLIKKK